MEELSYAGLKSMDKAEYQKAFKKPANWRKAKGVLFLAKHNFKNGKAKLVAIPFKKFNEAAKCFKDEVKKDTGAYRYNAKLTMLAAFELVKNESGILTAQITPMQGGLNDDYLESTGKELFAKLKMDLNVIGEQHLSAGDLEQVHNESVVGGEPIFGDKEEKMTASESETELARTKERTNNINKMLQNLPKIDAAVEEANVTVLQEKLDQYKEVLKGLEGETTTTAETSDLQQIKIAIANIEQKIANTPTNQTASLDTDAFLDNLENAEFAEEQSEKDALDIDDLSDQRANLQKKNRKKVNTLLKQLDKVKNEIVGNKITADQAIIELNKLQGKVLEGLSLKNDEEDSDKETYAIIKQLNVEIKELKSYVEEKLRPRSEETKELEATLLAEMKATGKNAALLIEDLTENTLKKMDGQFSVHFNQLNKFYQN